MKKLGWLLGLWMVAHVCHAEAKCPWLNAATAGGLLGGEVEMTVSAPMPPVRDEGVGQASYPDQIRMDRFDTTCEFSRKTSAGVDVLRIAVKTPADPAAEYAGLVAGCGGTTAALKGIGNEAVFCAAKAGEERVIGRVRERVFVMTVMRGEMQGDGGGLRDDTRNIAEQVAGSLF